MGREVKFLFILLLACSAYAQICPATHTYQLSDVSTKPPTVIEQYDRCDGVVEGVLPGFGFIWFVQPIPTPTPIPPVTTTINFDSPKPCPKLSGIYGGVDWGSAQWTCTGPWLALKENNAYFAGSVPSRQFTFVNPQILVSMDVTTSVKGTLTLTSDAGENFIVDISSGSVTTINTGWAKPAKVITVEFTQKWLLSVAHLVYR